MLLAFKIAELRYMKIKTLLFVILLFTPGLILAQATPPVAKEGGPALKATEKPLQILKPGVVASFGRFTMRGKAISQNLAEETPGSGKNPSPVTGSVKHIGPNRCAAVLSNGSEDATFSVSFELSQSTKKTLDHPKKKLFSSVLGPKKSVEREFGCDANDILQLSLKSGKEIRSN